MSPPLISHVTHQDSSKNRPTGRAPHPYLHGNFAPQTRIQDLKPCSFTGKIPQELAGGQYIRNGGNPVSNSDLGRDAHWFDGDGMLSGVLFRRLPDNSIHPEFVNKYILTDAYTSTVTTPELRLPILPSIATLVNPASSLAKILVRILRTVFLVVLSNLPGSKQAVKKLSVANTGILYHDGRALATCESGPPMRVSLPGLETVGWFNGRKTDGEPPMEEDVSGPGFGGNGLLSFMKEWTTAHPRVDPITNELILFHSTFIAPFVFYSIIPSTSSTLATPRIISASVPGVASAKMMHDFGVSRTHTIILDLPLSLDPRNLALNLPVVSYDPFSPSRFGIFCRHNPSTVRWFETNSCCIFHTANTWDEITLNPFTNAPVVAAVNMLTCRLTSASLVYSAGAMAAPIPKPATHQKYTAEEEQCRLYYYRFSLSRKDSQNTITHQFALSSIPFEFPSLRSDVSMTAARYIYGCSVSGSNFSAALGRAVKIDALVKVDCQALITRGIKNPPTSIIGCVDTRTVSEIITSTDPNDPIKVFKLPPGVYAQESSFVARENGESEDDGWIISYVFDESQLDGNGDAGSGSRSELWIIEAKEMKEVVCKVKLPQRVPYGLHGHWFSEEEILNQRPVDFLRYLPTEKKFGEQTGFWMERWMGARKMLLNALG